MKARFKKGFTLSELLLAVAIFAFAISSVLLLFINCTFFNEANRNLSVATSHAQFIMEEIRDLAKTDCPNLKNNVDSKSSWGVGGLDNESIVVSVILSSSVPQPLVSGTELWEVTVTVNWKNRDNKDRSATIKTLVGGS